MKLICGTNFSVNADAIASAAGALSIRMNVPLLLAHVVDPDIYDNPSEDFLAKIKNDRAIKLKLTAAKLRSSGAQVETAVLLGNPPHELTRLAEIEKAHLIVLSQVGPIAPTEWATGSVADKVTQLSRIPSLVLRNGRQLESWLSERRRLKVLVGYNFTPASEAALRWAAELSLLSECELTVSYVVSIRNELARSRRAFYSSRHSAEVLRTLLQCEVERVGGSTAAKHVRCLVDADLFRPAAQLLHHAEDSGSDLIVVGTSSRRGWSRLASVSRIILHSSRMNVATVPVVGNIEIEEDHGASPFLETNPKDQLANVLTTI